MTRLMSVPPSLEYHRKQAKTLLRAFADGDGQAAARFQQHHPRLAGLTPDRIRATSLQLADAQLVVAREQGFPSWPRFQAHLCASAERQSPTAPEGDDLATAAPPTILIVDDEPAARETMAEVLSMLSYRVETAATAAEALQLGEGQFFNLALLDQRLPDMRGTELLRRLKATYRDMVCIIVTGYASVDSAVDALHARAYAYIEKPLDMAKLVPVIQEGIREQMETMADRALLNEVRGRER